MASPAPASERPPRHHHQALLDSVAHKHQARPSLLTNFFSGGVPDPQDQVHEAPSSRGLVNLCMIILIILNLRLVFANIRKYGLIVDFGLLVRDFTLSDWPNLCILLASGGFVAVSYMLERLALDQITTKLGQPDLKPSTPIATPFIGLLQILNLVILMALPCVVILTFKPNPLSNINLLMTMICLFCKLWSYGDVNARLRSQYIQKAMEAKQKRATDEHLSDSTGSIFKATSPIEYPNNLSIGDLVYFVFAPTLCYETNFPRTERIRWLFVVKRTVELLVICFLEYFIAMQYMIPLLVNTLEPFSRAELFFLSERILKLAVPNMFIWLLGFYGFFHLWLNIIAELMCFGDRRFYEDWWNSTDVGTFWRKWNLPVKNWFFQHVHKPLLERGYSRTVALTVIFFFSALFHELVVSVAFSTLQFWAFGGMAMQVVAVFLSQPLKGKQIGNIFFWVTIMLGQPLIVLFYYVDYVRCQNI